MAGRRSESLGVGFFKIEVRRRKDDTQPCVMMTREKLPERASGGVSGYLSERDVNMDESVNPPPLVSLLMSK